MVSTDKIEEESINRAYRRVTNKLTSLGIKFSKVTNDEFLADVPLDKLPKVKSLLNKELKFLDVNIIQ